MEYSNLKYFEERALFGSNGIKVINSVFDKGESPFKECSDVSIEGCLFRWKYPIWYSKNVTVRDCTWFEGARAGVWYVNDIDVKNAMIQAPKNFRRCRGVSLSDVVFTDAKETMWSCEDIRLSNVSVCGDYFAMNSSDIEADGLKLSGNYSFDGVKRATVRNSVLVTKDAFWNSEDVTVYDSFITGEYLGWNAKNLTLINCTIESLQGMCYVDNLVMKGCKLVNTTLSFEYSKVDAEIDSGIDSVLNPGSGTIRAKEIGELIIQKDRIDPEKTKIICDSIKNTTDTINW